MRPRAALRAALACAFLALPPAASDPSGTAAAQSFPASPPLPPVPGAPASNPAADDPDAPPYERDLERLAERLGTLALMRDLCRDGDAAAFRDRMAGLLDAETRSAALRARLAGAFNRGVAGYAATYRTCTPSARLVISRALEEADRLARALQTRYGGT